MSFNLTQTVFSALNATMKTTTESGVGVQVPDKIHYPASSESLNFVVIPLAVLITVMLLSVMVFCIKIVKVVKSMF